MCDPAEKKTYTWQGWSDLPAPKVSRVVGEWVDLSHRITETLSRIPFFPQPTFRVLIEHPLVHEIQMVTHFGTHFDAPRHFIVDGPTVDKVPLERLYGPGVVWRLDCDDRTAIDVAMLERATPKLQPGDILFIDTGWWRHINTERYEEHPFLTGEAAEWLVTHGAKLVGVDFSTPDQAVHYRPKDFDFPVHNTLLSHGVLIAEHMTNLGGFAGSRIEAMFMPINLAGCDGAPARVVARAAD